MNLLLKNRKIILPFIIIIIILTLIFISFAIKNSHKTTETYSESNQNNISSVDISDDNILDVTIISDENTENNEDQITDNSVENNVSDNSQNSSTSQSNSSNYYIKVNYTANVVTIYSKDTNGNYTVPVKAMVCSTGISTPKSGVYKIPGRWQWGALFGGVYGQYVTKITGNILFHSVPYLESRNPASLEYWEYDKLGTTASAGCVRLTVSDALWIYQNCPNGTQVEFYSSCDPGPLGKPSAQKISSYESPYCNWDPTDPDSRNPWKNGIPASSTDNSSNVINSIENNEVISDNNTNIENDTNTDIDKKNDINTDNNIDSGNNDKNNNEANGNTSENYNSDNEASLNNMITDNLVINE